ncbi:hypothetical protein GCM10010964_43810 [Caldovatus sediminis]|uniref:Potassium channel domain-containing protein n=1 Tax=Caldovatus sediminis TaxID=2041189 RepID=A0A8J2ZFL5_9PROT|nr:potassium channel family protein [Caldovatus sediminis]GGG51869.1 hypothetical protein GCM10010964_43810 [Caldovatus sediminis]
MIVAFLHRLRARRHRLLRPPGLVGPLVWLLAMVGLFAAAMAALEGMPPEESLWLAVVTLTTVGYGDVAAQTVAGKLATVLLLMAGGVFVLAKLASDWFDWRDAVRERKRRGFWRWGMRDHVLIVGTPGEGEAAVRLFAGLVRQLRATAAFRDAPVALLTRAFDGRPEGLPQVLCDLGAVHVSGAPTDPDALAATDAGRARALVVLADAPQDPVSDAVAMDVLARVRALAEAAGRGEPPTAVVECVDDRNRPRLIAAGAVAAVRPLRTYPEMLARALVTPGAERLLEDLFTPDGNELHRVPLDRPWRGRWAELAYAVLRADIGTAIAYEAPDGAVVMNPGGLQEVVASALFLIQHDRQEPLLASRLPGALRAALVPPGEPAAAAPAPA